jgi:hypothetical protein
MSLRTISGAVHSDRLIHRAERVPGWQLIADAQPWRALCGVPIGRAGEGGAFEFGVGVALDPEAWRLAANCSACRDATERRELGCLG